MYTAMALTFTLGFLAIIFEHKIKVNKAASALITAAVCWVLYVFGQSSVEGSVEVIETNLMHHLGDIAGILFFLLGAMTIVELIDTHDGFSLITQRIKTTKKSTLLIILSVTTFLMSAALDNLTTSIIMAALLRKLIDDKKDLWLFAGMIIIAANAGGAWSPIGDVTTIMLWVGGQVTVVNIILKLLVPSIVCLAVPLTIMVYKMRGNVAVPEINEEEAGSLKVHVREQKLVLGAGLAALLFVPVFKTFTHLPPFLGIMFGLGILWTITEFLHKSKADSTRKQLSISKVLEKVDTVSILFFLGILLAVAALQTAGHLTQLATMLDENFGNIWIINILVGLFSSIIDNVPLVAGSIGMYDLSVYPQDHTFWELLAYCAGTGGSVLIIGSAAGVAIMGILKIEFMWYLKKISLLALVGYLSGILTFWLMSSL
ncbi:sodium:proton antiporter NhaD [Paracrocinitomix mangrovi]|uniref:sodium:proton antiporter NhaD n=1 Tax=Paracrocinitomix mangrovi TaxID=2862509 RepID=UPI001C8E41BF|nr:sodium:proton antiporter NhaD [Paracrocinitomix mangrovi]UKN00286.1 sodium:proton antiporter NhaD [Paracrocinitomix mangrovi]